MYNSEIIIGGTVIDFLQNACFSVRLDNGAQIQASVSVKLANSNHHISPGHRVMVHISPLDIENGEIIACHDQKHLKNKHDKRI